MHYSYTTRTLLKIHYMYLLHAYFIKVSLATDNVKQINNNRLLRNRLMPISYYLGDKAVQLRKLVYRVTDSMPIIIWSLALQAAN